MSKIQIQGRRHPLPTTISTSCPLHLVGEEGEKITATKNTIITLQEGGRTMMEKERRQRQKMRVREREA